MLSATLLTLQLSACPALRPATRRGVPDCWVEFELQSTRKLCISHQAWRQWLLQPDPQSLCGEWKGRWRVRSPLHNELDPVPSKTSIDVFQAKGLPANPRVHPNVLETLWQILERARERASGLLHPWDRWGVLRHLLLGEKKDSHRQNFIRRLGFIHLFTASGIHLYALAEFWSRVFLFLSSRLEIPISVALPLSRGLSAMSWTLAWFFAGAPLGMLRPWIVVCLRVLARILGFRWRLFAPLGVALGLDLALSLFGLTRNFSDPYRWYYALAVGGGLLCLDQKRNSWMFALSLAISSWIFVALFEIWKDGLVALATPILSFATIPVLALLYPLLWFLLSIGSLGASGLERVFEILSRFVSFLLDGAIRQSLSFDTLWIIPQEALLVGAVLALSTLLVTKRWNWSLLALILIARFGWTLRPQDQAPASIQKLEQLDVGQGDAAWVLDSNQRAGLIDTGAERALGEDAWIRFFAKRGVREISWIALTHLDQDHSGGVLQLARILPLGCILTSWQELHTPRGQKLARHLNKMGVSISVWESARSANCLPDFVAFIPPLQEETHGRNKNMSAILLTLGKESFYFSAGDANSKDEERLGRWVEKQFPALPSENSRRILKISHHGSRFSTDLGFLKRIQPTEAWISSGTSNRYGHPSPLVLKRLEMLAIPVKRTDQSGLIVLEP